MGSGSRSGRQCSDSASLVAARMPRIWRSAGMRVGWIRARLVTPRAADRPQYLSDNPQAPSAARARHQGESNASAQDRNTPAMAGRQAGTAGRGKTDAAGRRGGAAAPGLGTAGQDLPLADRCRQRHAGRPVPGPFAAAGLSLHVRAGLQGGLPVLLVDRRRFQRHRHASGASRRDAVGVSRAPLDKLQIYKRRMGWTFRGPRRPAAISTTTSMPRSPRPSSAKGRNTTSGATIPP